MSMTNNQNAPTAPSLSADNMTIRTEQLKTLSDDLLEQRKAYAAQLGAGLYEKTRNIPEMREGCESLFDSIADIDRRRAQIAEEIEALEAQARQVAAPVLTYACSRCGSTVLSTDVFCIGCGRFVSEIIAEAEESNPPTEPQPVEHNAPVTPVKACRACGATVFDDDRFCMNCGAELDDLASLVKKATGQYATVQEPPVEPSGQFPAEDAGQLPAASIAQGDTLEDSGPIVPDVCMHCGAPIVPSDALFCGVCGKQVR